MTRRNTLERDKTHIPSTTSVTSKTNAELKLCHGGVPLIGSRGEANHFFSFFFFSFSAYSQRHPM